jgi:hypothetical protein
VYNLCKKWEIFSIFRRIVQIGRKRIVPDVVCTRLISYYTRNYVFFVVLLLKKDQKNREYWRLDLLALPTNIRGDCAKPVIN